MFTYLMYDGRYYKIGESVNPEGRIKQLSTANPNLRLIAFGSGVTESYLHSKFKHKRYKLEWFDLKNKDVSKIIFLLKNEYNGIKSKKSFDLIQFGKYAGLYVQDLHTKQHIRYMKWYVKNSNNEYYKNLFVKRLKKLKANNIKVKKKKKNPIPVSTHILNREYKEITKRG